MMDQRSCLAGGGEAGALLRAVDWTSNPLGPVDSWPMSLQSAVRILLGSDFPMMIHWGPELITFYNDAYAPSLGRKHPGNMGRPAREWWSEMWDQLTPIFDKVLAGGSYYVEDARYTPDRRGAPEDAYFTHCHSPLWDDEGKVAGIFLVVTETTRRVTAERMLQESHMRLEREIAAFQVSEARLGALVSASSEVLYSMSADWSEMRQLSGGSFLADTSTANPKWLNEYIPADDQPRVAAAIRTAIETKSLFNLEHRVNRTDGGVGWTLSRATPLLDDKGEITEWFGAAADVTDRKRLESDLQESNARLASDVTLRTAERDRLWETSPDLLVMIDFDGVFRKVNPAWTVILGYGPEELVGHHVNEFVVAEHHAQTVKAYQQAAAGGQARIENRYVRKDGTFRTISWVSARAGDVIYATGRDVTQAKEAGEALRKAEEQLRQAQKVEAVGQLTGGVAHDFNNLLTVIRGSVDLLRRPGLTEARRVRYIDAIADTADRAARLTSQLLAFARRQTLKPVVFDARKSIANLSDMLGTLAGSQVEVTIDAGEDPCPVNADPNQFDTALVNMAVNARDAMNGAGTLTIRVRAVEGMPAIRNHAAVSGDFVAVSIADSGAGIRPEDIDRIFEPFFTTKTVGQGTGLGLSQVFGFAKQSGGEVIVESAPNAGAIFTLFLPKSPADQAAQVDDEDKASPLGHGACVLIVEDHAEVGQFATDALVELGYHTVLAMNGHDALDTLRGGADAFDVVFSDVVMPGMSGVELGEEIHRLYPSLPVILTSGYSTALVQHGTQGFAVLQKPYSVEELARALRKAAEGVQRKR
ncbi:hybrid sensor histidine kinase/response regulator [Sphingomonas xinjiangensis]|uniref:histidine kinase n=1 Tax=Sphingomonas xinjiangensis TaxID=643568 RepID=A0A840YKV0_9SPHN|nr:PAS domain-containing sensor histidine kinase [Sphingomonas xinjiangensis]MBB5709896.1 PAS domain S-box-containing protein [Sphingomonas xinjiangensis]